jgi:hypothetical protein
MTRILVPLFLLVNLTACAEIQKAKDWIHTGEHAQESQAKTEIVVKKAQEKGEQAKSQSKQEALRRVEEFRKKLKQ